MARAVCTVWTFCAILVSATGLAPEDIGVNWGSQTSHPLLPSIVAGMLKDNGIKKLKLFDADPWIVSAFAGTGIELMVGIANNQLKDLSDSYGNAKDWVKHNVSKHIRDGGVDIRYVGVGNEPFLTSYNGTYMKTTFPALKNIQKALDEAGHGDKIKATIPLNADVYESHSDSPSDGNFRKNIKDLMLQIVRFLHDNKSPFLVNIYPFLSLYQNSKFPVDFAFFDGAKPIQDKNIQYTNVFDANFDTLVWTLKKNNFEDMKIIVGEVGWPTDGNINANTKLAKRFYDGFLKKMASKKGTPLRPGPMEVYLFGLLDEDTKNVAPGAFERHWGIFRYDGQPKFPIDFSGKGHEKMPVAAKGVIYMDHQWCVLKNDVKNMTAAGPEVDYACSNSDCTSLGYGASCNDLDMRGNVSYAFNMYFQMQDQSVEACDFNGMAEIVKQNASRKSCFFQIQIMSAGDRIRLTYGVSIFVGLLLSLFAAA
ncbi:glucan endo-1,3-beta-glucosidase 8 [Alnus glutinosa]|uniref:glucan endo-1,3-beta-glucosidase 8 n=1 Tax=Alnus glutinosa TaxID=3517 RepID=UPI002D77D675|nr:glucan endo-1,3-beta-glucosidase 8 [Alnus glutinosa]